VNEYQIRLAFGAMAPRTIDRLLDTYGDEQRVVKAIGGGRTKASAHTVAAVSVAASLRLTELAALDVRLVGAGEAGYPERLTVFPGHPRWLFVRGADAQTPAIGIVGTRTCTRYGTDLARAYGQVAATGGWSVISGLARGIDGAAHFGATAAGGHCQAILGSGINVVYPKSHKALHASVLETGGVVMSEFPPGTPPEGWRFPTRNSRNLLQAHLANGTTVTLVESDATIPRNHGTYAPTLSRTYCRLCAPSGTVHNAG
jgi:DNA protecting protein DprA